MIWRDTEITNFQSFWNLLSEDERITVAQDWEISILGGCGGAYSYNPSYIDGEGTFPDVDFPDHCDGVLHENDMVDPANDCCPRCGWWVWDVYNDIDGEWVCDECYEECMEED